MITFFTGYNKRGGKTLWTGHVKQRIQVSSSGHVPGEAQNEPRQ